MLPAWPFSGLFCPMPIFILYYRSGLITWQSGSEKLTPDYALYGITESRDHRSDHVTLITWHLGHVITFVTCRILYPTTCDVIWAPVTWSGLIWNNRECKNVTNFQRIGPDPYTTEKLYQRLENTRIFSRWKSAQKPCNPIFSRTLNTMKVLIFITLSSKWAQNWIESSITI